MTFPAIGDDSFLPFCVAYPQDGVPILAQALAAKDARAVALLDQLSASQDPGYQGVLDMVSTYAGVAAAPAFLPDSAAGRGAPMVTLEAFYPYLLAHPNEAAPTLLQALATGAPGAKAVVDKLYSQAKAGDPTAVMIAVELDQLCEPVAAGSTFGTNAAPGGAAPAMPGMPAMPAPGGFFNSLFGGKQRALPELPTEILLAFASAFPQAASNVILAKLVRKVPGSEIVIQELYNRAMAGDTNARLAMWALQQQAALQGHWQWVPGAPGSTMPAIPDMPAPAMAAPTADAKAPQNAQVPWGSPGYPAAPTGARAPTASAKWPQSDDEMVAYYVALKTNGRNIPAGQTLPWGWHLDAVQANANGIMQEVAQRGLQNQADMAVASIAPQIPGSHGTVYVAPSAPGGGIANTMHNIASAVSSVAAPAHVDARSIFASPNWPQSDNEMIAYYVALETNGKNIPPGQLLPWGWHLDAVQANATSIPKEIKQRGLQMRADAAVMAQKASSAPITTFAGIEADPKLDQKIGHATMRAWLSAIQWNPLTEGGWCANLCATVPTAKPTASDVAEATKQLYENAEVIRLYAEAKLEDLRAEAAVKYPGELVDDETLHQLAVARITRRFQSALKGWWLQPLLPDGTAAGDDLTDIISSGVSSLADAISPGSGDTVSSVFNVVSQVAQNAPAAISAVKNIANLAQSGDPTAQQAATALRAASTTVQQANAAQAALDQTAQSAAAQSWPQSDADMISYYVALKTNGANIPPSGQLGWGWTLQSIQGNANGIVAEVQRRGLQAQADQQVAQLAPSAPAASSPAPGVPISSAAPGVVVNVNPPAGSNGPQDTRYYPPPTAAQALSGAIPRSFNVKLPPPKPKKSGPRTFHH